jgi:DNA-binding MarR family transcriptional regulator
MSDNQFKRGELYSFMTGKATTAIARRLQRNFKQAGLEITVEQWSVLYPLWKQDGLSQQDLCNATYRDKPGITRLVDKLEKQKLVKRMPSPTDRRINKVFLTDNGRVLESLTMQVAEQTMHEALEGVDPEQIEIARVMLQKVYDNLQSV